MKQKEMVLDYIKQFGSISTYEAFTDLGITRLAARIWDIKEDGQDFSVDWVTKTNRFGDEIKFKRYRFAPPVEVNQPDMFKGRK